MIRIPLLKDNHNHLFTYSSLSKAASLFYIENKKEAIQLLLNLPAAKILIATGWFDSYYNFSRKELDLFPPIIILNNSLHKYIFNTKAAEIIGQDFPDWVQNNNDYRWVEKNLQQILSYVSGLNGFSPKILQETIQKNLELGVSFASDMYISNLDIIKYASNNDLSEFTEIWAEPKVFSELNKKLKDSCKGVKLFTDGAIGGHTAAIKSYTTGGKAFLTYSNNELFEKLEQALSLNTNISIHCIGDLAIGQTLNALKEFKSKINNQIRLEHLQLITKEQANLAKDLGITLCMQPNFNMDSVVYSDRLSIEYRKKNNPFRMLIDQAGFVPGEDLIFGSDGMPTGIEGCIQQSLFPPVAGQKLSLEEFTNAYCTDNLDKGYINLHIDNLKNKVVSEVKLITD